MVAQHWECIKNYWAVHFKAVNAMVCELYLGKAVINMGSPIWRWGSYEDEMKKHIQSAYGTVPSIICFLVC